MRIMGLDVGRKRIGVSVSDALGLTAQGVGVIAYEQGEQTLARITALIEEHDVHKVVIGLPKNMDGSIGQTGVLCQDFAEQLRTATGLPVYMWDERLTTQTAERVLIDADVSRSKRKQVVDKLAAVVILQGYLDAHQP